MYDEGLAQRLRDEIGDRPGIVEKKMFGGLAFLLHGNMSVGVHTESLMVRVGVDRWQEALGRHGAREMDFTGRSLKGWVTVDPEGFEEDDDLRYWVSSGLDFAGSLPPK